LQQIKKAKHKAFTIDKVALLVPISQIKKILGNQTDRDELIRIIKNLNIREYDSNLLLRILQRGKISLLEDLRWEREARDRQKIIDLLEKKQNQTTTTNKETTENIIKSAIDTYNKKPRSENIKTYMETETIEKTEQKPEQKLKLEPQPLETVEAPPVETVEVHPVEIVEVLPVETVEVPPVETVEVPPVETVEDPLKKLRKKF
jgi:hypothetical protein